MEPSVDPSGWKLFAKSFAADVVSTVEQVAGHTWRCETAGIKFASCLGGSVSDVRSLHFGPFPLAAARSGS